MPKPPTRPPARTGPKSDRPRPEAVPSRARNLGDKALGVLMDRRSRPAGMAIIETLARTDVDERRRFAAAAARVYGSAGPNALLSAARIYVGDLWALASVAETMGERRKIMGILAEIAAQALPPTLEPTRRTPVTKPRSRT
ncbi:hypothetical protein [Azospirillum sp.]|uniref:hypothetical protein n=1 Tax=Azospirillum sp. TaxID=34012 RepID=UPI003D715224